MTHQKVLGTVTALAAGILLGTASTSASPARAASLCPALKQAQRWSPLPSKDELLAMLQQGAEPNELCSWADDFADTGSSPDPEWDFRPLNVLLGSDAFESVKALLDAGADVNARDGKGKTSLFYVGSDDAEPNREAEAIAQRLLDLGTDPNARDNDGLTPLYNIYYRHSLPMTELLIAAGARADTVVGDDERLTPLHFISQPGIAALLIREGADVNAQTWIGFTPLHYAVSKRAELVRLLLDAGADWRLENDRGDAPIHDPGTKPEVMTAMLEAGVDVNLRNSQNQQTALHVHNLNAEVTRVLLANGAGVNAQDSLGRSPLHDSSPKVATQLIAAGADINLQDNQDQTPLHRAVLEEEAYWGPEMSSLLANEGADLTLRNKQGKTALDLAKDLQKTEIVNILQSGASLSFNDTQFHWARACIDGMRGQGLLQGYGDRSFRPDGTMTRAEFAAVMVKAFPNRPVIRKAPDFSDVPQSHWAKAAIAAAYQHNFLSGYPGNLFKPNQPITRVQALTILANTQREAISPAQVAVLDYFDDRGEIPNYAEGAIAAATRSRLVVNYPSVTQLRPNDNLTRAEAATFLCQATAETDRLEPQYAVPAEYVVAPS